MIDYDRRKWSSHLFDIRGSLVREIAARMTTVALWAVVVEVAFYLCRRSDLPFPSLPSTVHSLVGVALGLLLVFRTNASYDRFWEGRKLWGGIVNETRNLSRLALVHLESDRPTAVKIVRHTIAFVYSTMHQLRGEKSVGPSTIAIEPAARHEFESQPHPPMAIAKEITRLICDSHRREIIGPKAMFMLDQNVQLLVDYLGACERIHKTPLPYAYVVHLRRALIFYLASLPFVFAGTHGWWSVPCTLLISFIFLGIEEIGVEIEDPFEGEPNDLPLEQICANIDKNLNDLM